jgi:hypothetical protein
MNKPQKHPNTSNFDGIGYKPENKKNTKDENMLIAKKFIANHIKIHGKHQVFTDGGTRYPQICKIIINN